ncbi:MAG: hypothetical protein JJT94_13875 [Bernardetiaceae bacterium]|nr:hypothetical protein [Bernardetiaceae bacterium]
MKKHIILSEKRWHHGMAAALEKRVAAQWVLIDQKEDFTFENLQNLQADKIFIPHWSYIIPAKIYENFECIVFHMTDLPYGRGGSPLQNLIVRGIKQTKISAIRVTKELDAGQIYLKKDLPLYGTAQEVFFRAVPLIEEMIIEIINQNIQPQEQIGEVTTFKRRKPEEGNIKALKTIEEVYDYIRMLDAETYPKAFVEIDNFRIEFSRASINADQTLSADVRIIPK